MSKQVIDRNRELDIEREYQLCSVPGKRTWNDIEALINEVAKENNLTQEEIEALKQRKMADLRYSELRNENEYLSRNQDATAIRKIDKNKLEMQRMARIYYEKAPEVAYIEPPLNEKIQELTEQRIKENEELLKSKQQKTGK